MKTYHKIGTALGLIGALALGYAGKSYAETRRLPVATPAVPETSGGEGISAPGNQSATINSSSSLSSTAQTESRPKVAVLDFRYNTNGRPNIEDMLATSLGESNCVSLYERTSLAKIFEELRIGRTGVIDERTAVEIGRLAGVEKVILGSYNVAGENARIDIRYVDVRTGAVERTDSITGAADDLSLVDNLSTSLLDKICGTEARAPTPNDSDYVPRSNEAGAVDLFYCTKTRTFKIEQADGNYREFIDSNRCFEVANNPQIIREPRVFIGTRLPLLYDPAAHIYRVKINNSELILVDAVGCAGIDETIRPDTGNIDFNAPPDVGDTLPNPFSTEEIPIEIPGPMVPQGEAPGGGRPEGQEYRIKMPTTPGEEIPIEIPGPMVPQAEIPDL